MDKTRQVIYQIYPKSFKDTTGNGLGDLRGILSKLDYLKDLGVDLLWLNPFYPSPQHDNGYDVADYMAVDPMYGTMEDFEALVAAADQKGMGIMVDMVLNHCSTDHPWFQKALAGDPDYQDFFYLRPAKVDGSLPNNWQSKFGGPAWAPFGDTDLYYLHLYDVHQADLNWHNPRVRQALYEVVRFWMGKGVKGFRFDVLNVIGKSLDLVDSPEPGSSQEKALYTDTPIVHEWVQEMNQATFGRREDILTVGEMSSTDVANGILYTRPDRQELDMIFSFHHLKVDYVQGDKWTLGDFDFIQLKAILDEWQAGMAAGGGWNALFWNNHDQPRSNSRFGDPDRYPYETATLLAQTLHLMRGTPYIYQGEEIGMTNPDFQDIHSYRDVETLNHYQILLSQGVSQEEALAIIQAKSRDTARTPMQWDGSAQAGFSQGEPWIDLADNYPDINVAKELVQGRIYPYYQALVQLRKTYPIIAEGDYQGLFLDHPRVLAYLRSHGSQRLLVLSHFYPGQADIDLPADLAVEDAVKLIGNGSCQHLSQQMILGPYETVAFLWSK